MIYMTFALQLSGGTVLFPSSEEFGTGLPHQITTFGSA